VGTYNVSSVALDGEDDSRAYDRSNNGTNGPEKCQAVQHLPERLAGLVPEVKSLAELSTTGSVDAANILNVCVDTGAERRTLGQRGDTARRGHIHDAQDVYYEELNTNGEHHGRGGHGEDTDRRVMGTCAAVEG
jgi:hypothetical protein